MTTDVTVILTGLFKNEQEEEREETEACRHTAGSQRPYKVSLSSHLGLEELWDLVVRRDSPSAVTST